MEKLQVKTIQYGAFNLDVAVDSEKNIFISSRTVEKMLKWNADQFREKYGSKSFKAFTDIDPKSVKSLGKIEGKKTNVALYPLEIFTLAISYAAVVEQNAKAIALLASSFSTDIKSTILRGFGHELEIDSLRLQEQFRWLRVFQLREWTDVIRDRHLECFECKPSSEYYRECIVMVNLALFDTHNFKKDRDNMDTDQQELIRDFEKMLVRQAKKHPDYDPKELIIHTLPMF